MEAVKLSDDLAPVISTTMADKVENSLLEYLKRKSFKPGDALPKEMELAQALGVSRNVLREALSRLRMLGMIETRKRRGMILTRPDILGTFEKVLNPLIIDEETLQDIFELRLVLEMGMADLLFLRKTDKDLDELELIAKRESKEIPDNFRIKNEIAFHGKLYEITGNQTLKRFQGMLLPVFGYVMKVEKKYKHSKVTHLDLVRILRKGTKDQFRTAMGEHLKQHFEKLS